MKHIITAIVVIVCIVVGGFGAHFLKSGGGGGGPAHASSGGGAGGGDSHGGDRSHGSEAGHGGGGHGAPAASSGGHGASGGSSGNVSYYRFSREFVVPILDGDRVASLVILNINLEVDNAISSQLFSQEPKLRDNIMSTLIALSSDGDTFQNITRVESYESVRSMVLMNLKNVVPHGIENVLIVDMAKQDL